MMLVQSLLYVGMFVIQSLVLHAQETVTPEKTGEQVTDALKENSQEKPQENTSAAPQENPAPEGKHDTSHEEAALPENKEKEAGVAQPEHVQENTQEPMPAAPNEAQAEEIMKKREEEKENISESAQPPAEGIDTLEQEGGNWLLKRQALEKTVNIIEEINTYFTRILEIRIDYLMKRNKVDREFDLFMNKIGFDLGDLHNTLQAMESSLEKQRKEMGDLTESERTTLQDLEEKIKEIQHIKETLVTIADLDASLDDVIMQVEKEISTSNIYQSEAWKNFQMIKKILSDEKAEELYLTTQGLLKNMQQIEVYLKGKLLEYFNGIVGRLQQEMSTLESTFETLKERGINIEEELKKLLSGQEQHEETPKPEEVHPEAKKEKPAPQGWLGYIASLLWSPFHALFNYITSWFSSTPKTVVKKEVVPISS